MDSSGKLIMGSLKEYTREKLRARYRSLDDFLQHWNAASKKQVLLQELEEQGIMAEELQEAVSKDMNIFDLLCHIAYDQPPLTKAERIKQVKKRDYFSRYGEQARKVLEVLLDKYAEEGIVSLEDMKILQVTPLNQFGSPVEIVSFFGGKAAYLRAMADLEQELYRAA